MKQNKANDKVIIEFTLGGRKNTYYRRTDLFGNVLITTNINSAKQIQQSKAKPIVEIIIKQLGKNNVTDLILKPIEEVTT